MAARRVRLAPTDRRQPPERFQKAPTKCTGSCTHDHPRHTHMHNSLHTALPHASTRARQQQLSSSNGSNSSSDSGADGDNKDGDIPGRLQWLAVAALNIPSSTALASASCPFAQLAVGCSRRRDARRVSHLCQPPQPWQPSSAAAASGSLPARYRPCVSCCVSCWRQSCISFSRSGSLGQLHQPSWAWQLAAFSRYTAGMIWVVSCMFMHVMCCVLSVRTPEGVYKSH